MPAFAHCPSDVELSLWLQGRVCFGMPDLAFHHAGRLGNGLNPPEHAIATESDLHHTHFVVL